MVAINVNEKPETEIVLDTGSAGWLEVILNNDGKSRPCAVPKKYFDALFTWGFVSGTAGNASLTPTGRGRAMEEKEAREERKKAEAAKAKKKK